MSRIGYPVHFYGAGPGWNRVQKSGPSPNTGWNRVQNF